MPVGLVIFDCDGVLVDSERIANEELSRCLGEIGMPMSFEETVRTFKGRSGEDCRAIIARALGRPPPEHFGALLRERCRERFERELRPVAGVHEALARIRHPVCVASSSGHERIARSLILTGLHARFAGRVFSAEEVARGKPAPDLFLHAAARLGAAPSDCVVVEDSVPGVQAGVAAGMPVLGYADLTSATALAAAGARTFDDMRDLAGLLGPQG